MIISAEDVVVLKGREGKGCGVTVIVVLGATHHGVRLKSSSLESTLHAVIII